MKCFRKRHKLAWIAGISIAERLQNMVYLPQSGRRAAVLQEEKHEQDKENCFRRAGGRSAYRSRRRSASGPAGTVA